MKQLIKKRRGRPIGFKMEQESKDLIAKAKTGQKHKQETKDKISAGVLKVHETGAPIELIMSVDFYECGMFKDKRGYIRIDIPNPDGGVTYTQLYHVAIMERKIGRKLRRGEEIHHWGEKDDNRLGMITLCTSRPEHNILDRAKGIIDREHI